MYGALLALILLSNYFGFSFSATTTQASKTQAVTTTAAGTTAAIGTNFNVDRRLELCKRREQVFKGTMPIKDALQGLHLDIAYHLWNDAFMRYDPVTKQYSGFHYDMMSAVAQQGGFTFSYHLHPMEKGESWTNWLFRTVELYDLNSVYWLDTNARAEKGVMTIYGIVDTSTYLYARMPDAKEKTFWEQTLSFMNPFTNDVWYVFWAVTVATGIAYFFFEHGHNEDDVPNGNMGSVGGIANSLFLSQLQTSGAGGFAPQTPAGKILLMGWAWLILLYMAAYTGSMASVLVNAGKVVAPFTDLRSFIDSDRPLCAWGAPAEYIQKYYPRFVAKEGRLITKGDPITNMAAGKCDGVFEAKVSIDAAHNSKKLNPQCRHQIVGPPVTVGKGGWMSGGMKFDNKCTSLLKDTIAMLFVGLETEGVVTKHYDNMLALSADRKPSCSGSDKGESDDEMQQVTLPQMSGIFYVHGFLTLISFGFYAVQKIGTKMAQKVHEHVHHEHKDEQLEDGIEPEEVEDHSDRGMLKSLKESQHEMRHSMHTMRTEQQKLMEEVASLRKTLEESQQCLRQVADGATRAIADGSPASPRLIRNLVI